MKKKLLLIGIILALATYLSYSQILTKAFTQENVNLDILTNAIKEFEQGPYQTVYGMSIVSEDKTLNNLEKLLSNPQGPWIHKLSFDKKKQQVTELFGLENDTSIETSSVDYNCLLEHPLLRLYNPKNIILEETIASDKEEYKIFSYKDTETDKIIKKVDGDYYLVNYKFKVWVQTKPQIKFFKSTNFWQYETKTGPVYTASEIFFN